MSNESRRFAQMLAEFERRIKRLESGTRRTQLEHSSLENGRINAYDDQGAFRQSIGIQPDDTFAVTYANGPKPAQPTIPQTDSRELGFVVAIDGQVLNTNGSPAEPPADLQRFDVHVSDVDGFTPSPTETLTASLVARGSVFIGSDLTPKYIKVLAVSTSNVASDPSDQATAQALPVSNFAVSDTIVIGPNGRLVAGDPDGARLGFSDEGIRQFDEDGDLTLLFGNNPEAGNTLTVKGTQQDKRRNLCDNPKLGVNLDGYTTLRGNLSRVDGANVGTGWAARIAGNGTDSSPYVGFDVAGLSGRTVAFQATVYSEQSETVRLEVDGIDAQGTLVEEIPLAERAFVAGESRALSGVVRLAETTVDAEMQVILDAPTAPDASRFLDVSLCCIEVSPVVREYFDGDTVTQWGNPEYLANPDFETGSGGWIVSAGTTLTQSSAQVHSGNFSGQITPDSDPDTLTAIANVAVPVQPETDVPWHGWVYRTTDAVFRVQVLWFAGDNTFLSASEEERTPTGTGEWVQFGPVTSRSPAGAAKAQLQLNIDQSDSADVVYVDDLFLRGGTYEVTEGQWSAQPEQSVSTIVTPPTRTRINLCGNPKLENNAGGWGQLWADDFQRVDGAHMGTNWAARIIGDSGQRDYRALSVPAVETEPIVEYSIGLDVYSPQAETVHLAIDMFATPGDPGSYIKSDSAPSVDIPADTVVTLHARVTAAASTHVFTPFLIIQPGMADGEHVDATRCIIERSVRWEGYFDGDSANSAWTGEPENSTSVMIDVGTFQSETLASLSDEGSLSVQSLDTKELTVGAKPLQEYVDPGAGRILAHGFGPGGASPSTTSEIGWYEISFVQPAGRNVVLEGSIGHIRGDGAPISGIAAQFRYTTDGSAPRVDSPSLFNLEASDNGSVSFSRVMFEAPGSLVRILMCAKSWSGVNTWLGAPSWMIVRDGGPFVQERHLLNDGGGSTAPPEPPPEPVQSYIGSWRAVAGQTWNRHGFRANGIAIQGFYPDGWNGHNKAIFFFPWWDIESTLAGASIDFVTIYVYFWHWYYNAGGTAVFGHSFKSDPGGAYAIDRWGIAYHHIGKGVGKQCGLPDWVGHGFRDGWIKTVNLDAAFLGQSLEYYGKANWDAILYVGYTK